MFTMMYLTLTAGVYQKSVSAIELCYFSFAQTNRKNGKCANEW